MIHLGLRKYKDRHKGATFVLFGSGPSMLEWKDGYSPGSIKVGCNTVFMHKPDLDYYFIQDSGAVTQSENCYLNHQALYDSYQTNLMKFYVLSLDANASRFEQWMIRWLHVELSLNYIKN